MSAIWDLNIIIKDYKIGVIGHEAKIHMTSIKNYYLRINESSLSSQSSSSVYLQN